MVTRFLKNWARKILEEELLQARRNYIALDQKYCEKCLEHYTVDKDYQSFRRHIKGIIDGRH